MQGPLYNEGDKLFVSTVVDVISGNEDVDNAWMFRKRTVNCVIEQNNMFFYEFDDGFVENEMLCHIDERKCLSQVRDFNKNKI